MSWPRRVEVLNMGQVFCSVSENLRNPSKNISPRSSYAMPVRLRVSLASISTKSKWCYECQYWDAAGLYKPVVLSYVAGSSEKPARGARVCVAHRHLHVGMEAGLTKVRAADDTINTAIKPIAEGEQHDIRQSLQSCCRASMVSFMQHVYLGTWYLPRYAPTYPRGT